MYIHVHVGATLLACILLLLCSLTHSTPSSGVSVSHPDEQVAVGYVFNLGFPKAGSSSLFQFLQCRYRNKLDQSGVVSHYVCGRKHVLGSREYQTCGECIERAASSYQSWHLLKPSHLNRVYLQLNVSCSGSFAFSQMDYANSTHCSFPQIENLDYLLSDEVFPEAKFILLTRPVEHWIHSVKNFFDLKSRLIACLRRKPSLFPRYDVFNGGMQTDGVDRDDMLLSEWFQWHERYIQHLFFRRKLKHRLLVINIEESIPIVQEKIDRFLGFESLSLPAHRKNATLCWNHANQNKH